MRERIYDEIVKLDAATRLQLAQDILDSVASEAISPPVTEEQRVELRARLRTIGHIPRKKPPPPARISRRSLAWPSAVLGPL